MFRFPFDVHNPIGYTLAFAIQVTFQIIVNTTVACVLVIVISPCYVLISTAVDIKHEFDILNTSGRARAKGSDVKVTQQFNQFVQFHSESKRLIKQLVLSTFDFRQSKLIFSRLSLSLSYSLPLCLVDWLFIWLQVGKRFFGARSIRILFIFFMVDWKHLLNHVCNNNRIGWVK